MRMGSMFSGIGGLELAMESLGAEAAWQVENDPKASAVLVRHWPDVPNYGDVTSVDWSQVEPVELLTAGFPCQDISIAGRGAGLAGKRSGLWSEVVTAIRILRPRIVFVENVAAIVHRGLPAVLAHLAQMGYDATWGCFPAAQVGAPHGRERFFLIATDADYSTDDWQRSCPQLGQRSEERPTNTDGIGRQGGTGQQWPPGRGQSAHGGDSAPDPSGPRRRQESRGASSHEGKNGRRCSQDHHESGCAGPCQPAAHEFGQYTPAVRQWEALTRPAPAPTVGGRLSADFVEWMMGFPAGWTEGHAKSHRLRMLGNAVVPQHGLAAFLALSAQHDREHSGTSEGRSVGA